jgi:anti-anti-sigma factor
MSAEHVYNADEAVFTTDLGVFVHDTVAGVELLRVFGEVDLSSVPAFEDALRSAAGPEARIVVDLQACTFIDSSVLTALIRAERSYRGRFGIILPESGPVRRVFVITQLLEHLPITAAI